MPHKSPKASVAEAIRVCYFKWEFLRRNKKYQASYEDLWQKHGRLLARIAYPRFFYQHPIGDNLPDELIPRAHRGIWFGNLGPDGLGHIVSRCCEQWGVAFMKPQDSTTRLARLQDSWGLETKLHADGRLKPGDPMLLNPFWFRVPPAVVIGPDAIESMLNPLFPVANPFKLSGNSDWLVLGISRHSSKEEVLERVGQWYDEEVRPGQEKSDRFHLDKCQDYLRVWDARFKRKKIPWDKITQRKDRLLRRRALRLAWSETYDRHLAAGDTEIGASTKADEEHGLREGKYDPRATLARLKYQVDQAQQMIESGWRQLRAAPLLWVGPNPKKSPAQA